MNEISNTPKTVIDFFAGIGLVRYALERRGWREIFALDYSQQKSAIYNYHFGDNVYHIDNIHTIPSCRVPSATLAHASFPCTDISLAGGRKGLRGPESSAFWGFIRILAEMSDERPPLVLIENVEGLLTSNKQKDLLDVLNKLNDLGYNVDIMIINAACFVPQSRVRLFIVGVKGMSPHTVFEQNAILSQHTGARPDKIINFIRSNTHIKWYLSNLPQIPERVNNLDLILDTDDRWWTQLRSIYLFGQMSDVHKEKVSFLKNQDVWTYGTAFRRMRMRNGIKQSTAEVRFDGIAGCLRTPKGGSARQILVRAGFGQFDARLLNAREYARLMGADNYTMAPSLSLNNALFGFGDAVCVPVIEWISQYSLEPLYAHFVEHSLDTVAKQPQ